MSTTAFHVRFGPVTVRIEGQQKLARVLAILRSWLQLGLCETATTADVTFSFVADAEELHRLPGAVMAGRAASLADAVALDDGKAWLVSLQRGVDANRGQQWSVCPRDGTVLRASRFLPPLLLRFVHQHYFDADGIRASTFLYRHLIPIVQRHLMQHDATFVHASAVQATGNGTLLLSGWGGSGKTSASTALYWTSPDRWRFLSDDLAIVDASGTVHLCPLPLNVFPYNARGFAALDRYIQSGMGAVERLQWAVHARVLGPDRVARRVAPPDRYVGALESKIALCVHLQRGNVNAPAVTASKPADIAAVAAHILGYELRQGLELHAGAAAAGGGRVSGLLSSRELEAAATDVIRHALQRVPTFIMTVPVAWPPVVLAEYVAGVWQGAASGGSPPGASVRGEEPPTD